MFGAIGFVAGGGLGLLEIAGSGGVATPAAVATAYTSSLAGAAAGKALGELVSPYLFSKSPSRASKMQREVEKGQAPEDVKRVDRGNPHDPGDAEPHIHLDDGRALTQSGRWKHGAGEITRAVRNWLESHGWKGPGGE